MNVAIGDIDIEYFRKVRAVFGKCVLTCAEGRDGAEADDVAADQASGALLIDAAERKNRQRRRRRDRGESRGPQTIRFRMTSCPKRRRQERRICAAARGDP